MNGIYLGTVNWYSCSDHIIAVKYRTISINKEKDP